MTSWTSALIALPILAHELTHAAAAWPFADVSLELDRDVPRARMEWRSDAPLWAIYLAHLAPTIVGGLLALSAAVAWAVTGVAPLDALRAPWHLRAALVAFVGAWWLLYTYPSRDDRDPFRSAGVSG